MTPPKMKTETVGKCLTKRTIENYDELIQKYVRFIYFSQFARGISWRTTEIPDNVELRVEAHPVLKTGEIMFGMESDGTIKWLGEIIDSSD